MAISELVKEVEFVRQLWDHFGVQVKPPIPIFVANIGAIHMVRNNKGGSGTRHVNMRYHFVRDLHDDVIVMVFRGTKENKVDMLTKNSTKKKIETHLSKLVAVVPDVLLTKVKNEGGCQNPIDKGK